VSKILAQSIFPIGRPHNDSCIDASNVSSFNRLMWSLFIQLCFENPRSRIVVLAKPKLQLVPSWNCRIYWNLEVSARVPRLESLMFLFANCGHCILWQAIFGEAYTVKSENIAKHTSVKCPKTKQKPSLMAKMAFDKCWRLQYWTPDFNRLYFQVNRLYLKLNRFICN
jgi:hypothetical protein